MYMDLFTIPVGLEISHHFVFLDSATSTWSICLPTTLLVPRSESATSSRTPIEEGYKLKPRSTIEEEWKKLSELDSYSESQNTRLEVYQTGARWEKSQTQRMKFHVLVLIAPLEWTWTTFTHQFCFWEKNKGALLEYRKNLEQGRINQAFPNPSQPFVTLNRTNGDDVDSASWWFSISHVSRMLLLQVSGCKLISHT